jgi:hypothetical protein
MFEWRDALWNVKPDTLIRWHHKRIPAVLALEIQADGKTAAAEGPAPVDPSDGGGHDGRRRPVASGRPADDVVVAARTIVASADKILTEYSHPG